MKENQPAIAILAFIVGAAVAIAVVSVLKKPACQDPSDYEHTIKIFFDDMTEPPQLMVEPDPAGPAENCDSVTFLNDTGQKITIDFGGAAGSIGTPLNDIVKFEIEPAGEGVGYTRSARVLVETPEEPVDYKYLVSVGETEQSPVIRIGPRKPSEIENP